MNRLATTAAATVLLLLPATAALGQSQLLVSGGLNRASVASSEDTGDAQKSVMRLAIGLAVGIPVSEGLNLQLGASYSQKGFGLGAEGFGEVTTEIDYLELTALVSKPFPVGDRASAYLLAGPALALKLSCQFAGTEPGRQRPGQLFHQPGRHRPGQLVHQEPGADAAGGLGLLDRLRAGL